MSRTKRAVNEWENGWRKTIDKKRGNKPTKTFKKCQKIKDDAKPKQRLKEAIAHGDDFDEVVLPETKRHHEWDWN